MDFTRINLLIMALIVFMVTINLSFSAGPTLKYDNIQFASRVGGCLDANTGQEGEATYMRPCDDKGNANLRWDAVRKVNGFQLRTRTNGNCLDANTGQEGQVTYMRACDNGDNPNLIWTFHHKGQGGFQIRSNTTGYCLDANTGALGQTTYMRQCDEGDNPNLRWGMEQ